MSKEVDEYRKRRQARLDAKKAEQRSIISAYRQRRWDRLDARGFSFEDILNITTKGSNKSSQSPAYSGILRGKPLTQIPKNDIINGRKRVINRTDDDDKDVIYRTAENGNKYAINAETGEILGGLGPELEGQKVGRVLSEQAPSVQKMFDSLDKMPFNTPAERRAFAEKLIDNMGIDRTGIEVAIGDTGTKMGVCSFSIMPDNRVDMYQFALSDNDSRALQYQVKTALHEGYHLRADGDETDFHVLDVADRENWRKIEETFAETSAHYAAEFLGIKGIHPAVPEAIIDVLPRLKRTDEFAECTQLSDFGKIALEKRLAGDGSKWKDLQDKLYSQAFDKDKYVRRYADSIEKNADNYLEAMLAANPDNRPYKKYMREDIDRIVKALKSDKDMPVYTDGIKMVYEGVLVEAMSREGVY